VMRNAIAPCFTNCFSHDQSILAAKTPVPTLAYTSTPFRGLDLLLDVFPLIQHAIPGVQLKVFSSLKVYQIAEDQDGHHALYQRCHAMEGVDYVGSLPQPDLVKALRTVTILSYPNIFPETFCIAALEAMACGCQVITSNLGALPETTAGFARLIPIRQTVSSQSRAVDLTSEERDSYCHLFAREAIAALKQLQVEPSAVDAHLRQQVDYVNQHGTWAVRAQEWLIWLRSLGLGS